MTVRNQEIWVQIEAAFDYFQRTPGEWVPTRSIASRVDAAIADTGAFNAEVDAAVQDGRLKHKGPSDGGIPSLSRKANGNP